MNANPLIFSVLLGATALAQDAAPPQVVVPPEALELGGGAGAVSRTKQFRIVGGEVADRGAAAAMAEEAKDELLRLTEEEDAWKIPVQIVLHGKLGDPLPRRTVAMQLFFNELGYQLRLDVHLSRGLEPRLVKAAVTSALIYDRGLGSLPARESETPFLVPPWLVDGLREATAWRLGLSDRRLYGALFKTGGLFKLDELFSLDEREFDELDGATRAAFGVSSGALVMALLQQPQGKEGFRAFLTEVAAFEGEMPSLLRKHFPELNLSETSLSKWWALQLANIGAQNLLSDVLSIPQTETALAEALRWDSRTAEGIVEKKDLSAWEEFVQLPVAERAIQVRERREALVRLSYRCFPSYRPILEEYQLLLNAMAGELPKDVPERLAALEERRALMGARAVQARDYLDWFEITRARETSGEFDDYIRLKERLKANPHRRTDRLSKYLDRMDEIFTRQGTVD
jgi:hypothetical protein